MEDPLYAKDVVVQQRAYRWRLENKNADDTTSKRDFPSKLQQITELRGERAELEFWNNGEISGFMHWSEQQEKISDENPARLFCYTDVVG